MYDVLTIREAVQRAKADGLPVSEYSLRRWIKSGQLPARRIGAKALLFYPNLVRFIQCDGQESQLSDEPGIRRVDM